MFGEKVILICIAGLILNLCGFAVAEIFNLPLYLDTPGTIFIAALGGYMPGITVGFFTNLFKAGLEPQQMYYCSISVLVAIFTASFAKKGFCDSFGKMLLLIPVLTFLTGTLDLIIENFLNSASVFQSVNEIRLNYTENFFKEFIDKTFSTLLAFMLLKFTPPQIKKSFQSFGQRQADLSDEMKNFMDAKKYSSSLRTKLLLILILSSFLVSFSIALISYLLFKDSATDDRIKTVDGMVAVVLNEINPDHIDAYIKNGRASEEYRGIEERLYAIKNSNTYIKYIYVYKISAEGCRVIFDLDTGIVEGDKPGKLVPFDKSLAPYVDDLIAGKPIPPIISDDEYGYLLTLYKPLYDVNGNCQCYAAVDYSMDILTDYIRAFIIKLIALFIGCFIFISAMGLVFVENHIILPINTMAYYAWNFSFDSEAARKKNIAQIRSLKIKTGDEIENLYCALIRTTENILKYLETLQRARSQVSDMILKVLEMDEIAHKDPLTGIKNKTAYAEEIAKLDKKISAGDVEFFIAMVDVNFLKRVNDTYGHERGNEYLINACKLVCSVFGEEHVYRIGGDEFVVIVEGEKVSLCKYFVTQFKAEMERKNSNPLLAAWEKVSAAVGTANYQRGVDKTADEVFKRADKEMYANKLAMKAARTD